MLLFIVLTPFRQGAWSTELVILVLGVDALGILFVLALYEPKRFHWAGRAGTGLVFVAFVWYLFDEIARGGSWYSDRISEPGSINALLGLLVFGVPCLRYTLLGRFARKPEIQSCDSDTQLWLTGQCSQCPKAFPEHEWALFATTVATKQNKDRLTEFFEKVKEHDWRSVAKFQDFDATQNDMLVFAVRCVSGGFVFVVRSPFELWEDDEVYLREPVTQAEMAEIESHIQPDSWNASTSAGSRTSGSSQAAQD